MFGRVNGRSAASGFPLMQDGTFSGTVLCTTSRQLMRLGQDGYSFRRAEMLAADELVVLVLFVSLTIKPLLHHLCFRASPLLSTDVVSRASGTPTILFPAELNVSQGLFIRTLQFLSNGRETRRMLGTSSFRSMAPWYGVPIPRPEPEKLSKSRFT